MNKTLKKLVFAGILAGSFTSLVALGADHNCSDCHGSATPGANDLVNPLASLCADCHRERIAAGEHQVDISVNIPGNTLPLQDGQLTCITCHDPHKGVAALRMTDPEICRQCHTR